MDQSSSKPGDQEASLLAEYHGLVDIELAGTLSDQQAARLTDIEAALDATDSQRPDVQLLQAKIEDGNRKLDEVINSL